MRHLFLLYMLCSVLSLSAQTSKLSPFVKKAMMENKSVIPSSMSKGVNNKNTCSVPEIMAFVRTTDVNILRSEGCRIYAQWDDIIIAAIPLNKISHLASLPQIQRIEANKSCFITNDTTASITRVRDVWQQTLTQHPSPITLNGNGVVVGVMDIGFDLTHPTFYSSDGERYRISRLWDQLDMSQSGELVTGKTDEGTDTIYVGRQYIGQSALLALQHSYDGFTQTHGTHTTGTAAGSGWQGTSHPTSITHHLYSGMAPDADICLVCNMSGDNAPLIPDSLLYLYTSATDMLGFKYIFDYADSQGKPCVISFSEGAYDDLYESGIYGEVLNKMLGRGHILCASAGNDGGGSGTYIHKAVGETGKGAFLAKWAENTAVYVMRSQKPVQMRLSFYNEGEKALDKDYDLRELSSYPDSVMIDTISINTDTLLVYLNTYPSCFDESLYATDFFLVDVNNEHCGYAVPTSMTLSDEDNDIEVFCGGGYFVSNNLDASLDDFDQTHNVMFPGSVKDVICVGATSYVTGRKNIYGNTVGGNWGKDGEKASFSSVGPAITGLMKPDVMAPGVNIASSYSSFYREKNPSTAYIDILQTEFNGRMYPWGISTGTSMSTPCVAGIVALWLQICPTLTPDDIKDVIAHTATHYPSTGSGLEYPNSQYGWGQIDAMAGLEYIQKVYTGIVQIENGKLSFDEFRNRNSDGIYTLDGRLMKSIDGQRGVFIIGGNKVVR